jgi:hypothetical protein
MTLLGKGNIYFSVKKINQFSAVHGRRIAQTIVVIELYTSLHKRHSLTLNYVALLLTQGLASCHATLNGTLGVKKLLNTHHLHPFIALAHWLNMHNTHAVAMGYNHANVRIVISAATHACDGITLHRATPTKSQIAREKLIYRDLGRHNFLPATLHKAQSQKYD